MPEATTALRKAVKYGVEKAHYAVRNDDGTYGAPKPLLGAVSVTVDPEGESNPFYADNSIYFDEETNAGYTGKFEVAYLEDEARADLLGEIIDAIGGIYDDADASGSHVAFMWQTNGNVRNKRVVYYDVSFKRPSEADQTKNEKTDPGTFELEFTAVPVEIEVGDRTSKTSKYSLPSDKAEAKAAYDKWFEAVAMPQAAAA
ncbi:major tail protein [Adlercreutzia caecimuris]|uniref:major tail protein n=1 Tax=Adlercreutzia caecimuris TaxID=671266 RepID=UPI0025899509|nr:major tail protein [Adlercreutzia caecimuris]